MGHGEYHFPPMPDYRKYKVEDIPVLQQTQEKLAFHGLRDPWLRNEVWRYQSDGKIPQAPLARFVFILSHGFKYGLVLALCATAIKKTFLDQHEEHH